MSGVGLAATGGATAEERLQANFDIALCHDTIDGALEQDEGKGKDVLGDGS